MHATLNAYLYPTARRRTSSAKLKDLKRNFIFFGIVVLWLSTTLER